MGEEIAVKINRQKYNERNTTKRMNVVIYARFSDSKQREESIEAQLKVCHKYAEENGYTVIGEYKDRALSGRSDERPQFQKMIRDSKRKQFEKVIVYRLDRFSRDEYDPIIYMSKLRDNGVEVESATERIPNNSTGKLLKFLILGSNSSYSDELGEKVIRNMELNADKCLSNGGTTPLGYKLERLDPTNEKSKKRYVLDEKTAPIVQEVFTKYADGWSIVRICNSLNERHLLSAQKKPFNKNSLHTMLKNRKYLGIYIFKGKEHPDGMPQIISQELFDKVQERMVANKKAPARSRARAEYILSGKLFCGYCGEKMVGHSSNWTNKRGFIYNYYKCKNAGGGKSCKKKMIPKNEIEDIVVNECRKLLTEKNIRRISKEVVKISKSMDDRTELDRLQKLMKKANEEKLNQMVSLRACSDDTVRNMIFEDLGSIAKEIDALEAAISKEEARHYVMTEQQITAHLQELAEGDVNDLEYRRTLIKVFVNAVYLWDDKFIITLSVGDEEVTISNVLLKKIAKDMDTEKLCLLNNPVHQKSTNFDKGFVDFVLPFTFSWLCVILATGKRQIEIYGGKRMKYEIMPCTDKDGDYIDDMICEYNLSQMPVEGDSKRVVGWFGKKMTDGDGKIIAGCTAVRSVWGTAEVDFLWVDEAYRKQGLGSQLLCEVERVIKESGCTIIQLDTFDWQARGFYEKNGYSVFGTLEDCPKGHCRYYMKKSL